MERAGSIVMLAVPVLLALSGLAVQPAAATLSALRKSNPPNVPRCGGAMPFELVHFNQKVDHFNPERNATFRQRALINTTYWEHGERRGPILVSDSYWDGGN